MSFLKDLEVVAGSLDRYMGESVSEGRPVIRQEPMAEIIDRLKLSSYMQDGGLTGERLAEFMREYLDNTTRLHHPGYMSHQVAVPHPSGSLGALIDAFTNNPMAIYEMGPGAAAIEYFLINRLLEKVGWQSAPLKHDPADNRPYGGGVLTHGGSLANLTVLVAARNRIAPDVWSKGSPGDLAVIAPPGSHYSILRGAGILGIGREAVYHPDVDASGAIIPDRLNQTYRRLRDEGRRCMALVANACSTAVGGYDPLEETAAFCRENGIWFHVDGAHGASVLLSERHREKLAGVEGADSLTWDAHKLMRTPNLCAIVLVRDHRSIDTVFMQEASYLFHEKEQPGFDFIHRTVECTKAGLGLRLFMVLASIGEKGIAEYIDGRFALAQEAYEYISREEGFECALRPQSNILCFRARGVDEDQLKIRDRLNSLGRYYLSTTEFNGKRYLRMALMNPNTGLDTIRGMIGEIKKMMGNGG